MKKINKKAIEKDIKDFFKDLSAEKMFDFYNILLNSGFRVDDLMTINQALIKVFKIKK